MADRHVLTTGDTIEFDADFGGASIPDLQAPVELSGSGSPMGVVSADVCVEGDELPTSLAAPMAYTTDTHSTPGMGTLAITLDDTHWTTVMTCEGRRILRVGGPIEATFTVVAPAIQPGAFPVPDLTPEYAATARYVKAGDDLVTAD